MTNTYSSASEDRTKETDIPAGDIVMEPSWTKMPDFITDIPNGFMSVRLVKAPAEKPEG